MCPPLKLTGIERLYNEGCANNSQRFRTVCKVRCPIGYEPEGYDSSYRCQVDESWNPSPNSINCVIQGFSLKIYCNNILIFFTSNFATNNCEILKVL